MIRRARVRTLRLATGLLLVSLLAAGCGNRVPAPDVAEPSQPAVTTPGLMPDNAAPVPEVNTAAPGTDVPTVPRASAPAVAGAPAAKPGVSKASKPTPGKAPAGTGSGAAGTSPTKTCAPGGSPITIGSIGAYSGVLGQATKGGLQGVQTWVKYINARGGLSCHPIRLLSADDSSDPARNQAMHRQMVEDQGAIAFVYEASPLGSAGSKDYLNAHRIPVIGDVGGTNYFYELPYFFPTYPLGLMIADFTVAAAAKVALAEGKKKLGFITCNEATLCTDADGVWADVGPKVGFDVVYRGRGSLAQPDWTAQCLAAKNAGVEVLISLLTSEGHRRVAQNCASVGLKPIKVAETVQALVSWKDDPIMDNYVVGSPVAPWFSTTIPGVRDYQAQLKRFAPTVDLGVQSLSGWTVGKHLELAGQNLPAGKVTGDDILRGLWAIDGSTLNGLTTPIKQAQGKPAQRQSCGWAITLRGGEWRQASGYFCRALG
jgi:branched-chain amino acid transport system substrate-binding protein